MKRIIIPILVSIILLGIAVYFGLLITDIKPTPEGKARIENRIKFIELCTEKGKYVNSDFNNTLTCK